MVIHQFLIKLGNNSKKKEQTLKLENSLNLKKKTINFKVMKIIRNQLIYPIGLQLPMLI